jgi:hypothetical protein
VKNISKILSAICCISFFVFGFSDSMAESRLATHRSSTAASLNFKIHIPATLYLQIGTITQKKDVYTSAVEPANTTSPELQSKQSRVIKTPNMTFKGGMIILSSSSNIPNAPHSQTAYYILSSP